MSIHSIRPAPATGLTRRDALRIAVAGSIGTGAATTAGALPAFAATAPLKGKLKHSVARWTFPQLSVAQLCTTVKDIGFAAIDWSARRTGPRCRRMACTARCATAQNWA